MREGLIPDRIAYAARLLGGQTRVSRRGVPHILVDTWREDDNLTVSVCYFGRSHTWKVFWPWDPGNYEKEQKRRTFDTLDEVAAFIEELGSGKDRDPTS